MSMDVSSISPATANSDAAVSSTTPTNDSAATGTTHQNSSSTFHTNPINSTTNNRAIDLAQTNRMAAQIMESHLNGKEYQHQQTNEWSKCIVDEVLEKINSTQPEGTANQYKYIGMDLDFNPPQLACGM